MANASKTVSDCQQALGKEGSAKVPQELREFEKNKRVRLVPSMRFLSGGHRFLLRRKAPPRESIMSWK
jgi:pantothenate synthetase